MRLIVHTQLADWLEFYAKAMELNVWTSANIEKLQKNQTTQDWTVAIKRSDGTTRTFKPRHVIFAHGFGGGVANMPEYPGLVSSPFLATIFIESEKGLRRINSKGKSSTPQSTRLRVSIKGRRLSLSEHVLQVSVADHWTTLHA